ncbi:MAG: ATP-binding cassette domain-containing protein [Blautia sp.]|nr:ATP-binding cassette domain-containing protein [Blautia sp.]
MKVKERRKRHVKTPAVFQMEAAECGAASLLMILRYYGCHVPMEEVRAACGVSRDGCNAAGIVMAAREYGLLSSGYRCTMERLREMPFPCILHWNGNHFVVLEGFKKNSALINDPAVGHRRISQTDLEEIFTGVVLVFKPGFAFRKVQAKRPIQEKMGENFRNFKSNWIFLILAGIVLVIPGLLSPILTQIFLDHVLLASARSWLSVVLLGLATITLCQMGLNYMRNGILSRMKVEQTLEANQDLLRKMFRLPLAFFDQRYAGDLAQREEAVGRIYEFIDGSLIDVAQNVFQALVFFLLMLLYSRKLTALSLFAAFLSVFVLSTVMRRLGDLAMKQNQDKNRMMGMLCAGLSVFGTVKASGCENEYLSMLVDQYAATTKSETRLSYSGEILGALPQTMFQMVTVTVLMVGSGLVINGEMTIGMLTAFTQVLGSFLSPIRQLLSMERQLQLLKADMEIVQDIHEALDDPYFPENQEKASYVPLEGAIEARHLSFGYMKNKLVVRDISFRMSPGSRIGIVGASGCGKSTVAKLVTGLLTPWDGEILFDDVKLEEIPEEVRCSCIAVVSQKEAFFSGSIRDNLTLWNQAAKEEDLFWALSDAEALGMVNALPGGMEYRLEEGGKNFSGGQLQQLAIARALVKHPSILILDEATSAMDVWNEKKIMSHLRNRGCSCLIVAHRLSTIRDCDLILVMENGVVAEAGTHEKLCSDQGLYARLYAGKET